MSISPICRHSVNSGMTTTCCGSTKALMMMISSVRRNGKLEELEGVGGGGRQHHRAEGGDAGELGGDPEGVGERILVPDADPGIERELDVVEPPPAEHVSACGRIEVTTMPRSGMIQMIDDDADDDRDPAGRLADHRRTCRALDDGRDGDDQHGDEQHQVAAAP